MKRLLTNATLEHTKQAANKFFTCSIAAVLAIALSLPAAGIPSLSYADEPEKETSTTIEAVDSNGNVVDSGSVSADSTTGAANGSGNVGADGSDATDAASSSMNTGDGSATTVADGNTFGRAALAGQYIPGEGYISSDPNAQPPEGDASISTTSINTSDPAQMQVLIDNRFTGIDPANTTVNLFDYTSYKNANGNDEQYGSTTPSNWLGTDAAPNINTHHLLAFGHGMVNDMGYWNAGAGSGKGDFSRQNPGFQNIVAPMLGEDGFPQLSTKSMEVSGYSDVNNDGVVQDCDVWPLVGGYDDNPPLYSKAKNVNALWGNGSFTFGAAGGKNVSTTVQNQWDGDTSLAYLFDTSPAAGRTPGRDKTHTDVKGLFQLDDQGYYYYNMRQNFAEYTDTEVQGRDGSTIPANSFILYDAPAGSRTDDNTVGNFFPFNTGEQVFKVENGKLVSDISSSNGAIGNDGNPTPADSNLAQGKPLIDHNLGMSIETSFRQPINGKVGTNDMTFEFVGDDDLWVYVDDVLVLDLGGIHSELYGTINFATGEVLMGTAFTTDAEGNSVKAEPTRKTTIKAMVEATDAENGTHLADDIRWNGDTFASSTSHTLKMFYFERGNYDSSLQVRFNLQPALYQQVKKVDQNGAPLAGAEFDLYAVNVPEGTDAENAKDVTLDQVTIQGAPLTHVVTDANGEAKFISSDTSRDGEPEPFNFSDRYDGGSEGLLYILRETKTPPGYKAVPTDLLLRFNPANTMLIVNNRYQSGAYASFNSYVTGNTGSIYYGQIGEDGGQVDAIPDDQLGGLASAHVPLDSQRYGLVVAIPMIKQTSYNSNRSWFPLYGDNLVGFQTIHMGDLNADYTEYKRNTRAATLTAAVMQSAENYRSIAGLDHNNTPGWYLEWDDSTGRLTGTLQNLPGSADRYMLTNPDGDMRSFYALIEPDALAKALGVSEANVRAMSSADRYRALGEKAMAAVDADGGKPGDAVNELVRTIDPYTDSLADRGYSALDIAEFIRNFRTVLYIPNEQRQLRVTKIDQNGVARNGAEFALYSSEADAKADTNRVSAGKTATVDGVDGMLIFEPRQSHDASVEGYADIAWPNVSYDTGAATYYLKETGAPAGCDLNDTVIPVKVGVYSIYADAGAADDGVSVSAGVGKLTQTMVQYASEGDVNITLRDITSFAQSQPSDAFGLQDWKDVYLEGTGSAQIPRYMNLHYGQNAVVDYGLSDADGGKNIQPFFVTDTGYLRTRVQQNLHAHDDPNDPEHSEANADDLLDMDITSLFSLINTVIVSDQDDSAPAAGNISISKTVEGENLSDSQFTHLFHFKFELRDKNGNAVPDTEKYYFYGRDRTGYIASGDEIVLHHDEDLVVMGIPEGYTYTVTETDANTEGLHVWPKSGKITGSVADGQTHEVAFKNSEEEAPDEPEDPNDPTNPSDPTNPDDPNGGDDGKGDGGTTDGSGSDEDGSFLEKMGDSIPLVLVAVCILAGAGALVARRYAASQAAEIARIGGKHAR